MHLAENGLLECEWKQGVQFGPRGSKPETGGSYPGN